MSKAVLILDMPNSCYECCLNNYHFCDVTTDSIEEYMNTEHRPDWCPLKKLPDEKSGADLYDEEEWGCQFGWNYFRDTILGEVEYEL